MFSHCIDVKQILGSTCRFYCWKVNFACWGFQTWVTLSQMTGSFSTSSCSFCCLLHMVLEYRLKDQNPIWVGVSKDKSCVEKMEYGERDNENFMLLPGSWLYLARQGELLHRTTTNVHRRIGCPCYRARKLEKRSCIDKKQESIFKSGARNNYFV